MSPLILHSGFQQGDFKVNNGTSFFVSFKNPLMEHFLCYNPTVSVPRPQQQWTLGDARVGEQRTGLSKQEAASLCLERRGISLRITGMKSLVGDDTWRSRAMTAPMTCKRRIVKLTHFHTLRSDLREMLSGLKWLNLTSKNSNIGFNTHFLIAASPAAHLLVWGLIQPPYCK